MSSPVGTLLDGRYRLDQRIGAGGHSMVFKAFDTTLERAVAIKLMHGEIAANPDQLERFRREARAVAQLNHPHIVTVIDAGEDDGRPYIVFEHVEGETLKQRIKAHGGLAVPEAVAYALEIARALCAAHAAGIVHRDVKPQNVLLGDEGAAKVTDFGIARSLGEEQLTADGRVLGTTDYVSPEQALGHDVTPQSDIYSLGIVLYEMLAGDVPFKGENQVAVAMKHVREELPDIQRMRPDVSAALAAVLDRATAKRLDARYPVCEELAEDLEEIFALESARAGEAHGEATSVLRTLPSRARDRVPLRVRHPAWPILGVLALIGLGVVLVVGLADNAQRGTGARQPVEERGELTEVSLKQRAASDFDPLGGDGEHPDEAALVLDGDTNTTWSTESYDGGQLGKAGVGLLLDAAPGLAARRIEVRSSGGWTGEIHVADGSKPAGAPGADPAWTRLAGGEMAARQSFDLDTAAQDHRWYLIWITALPPGSDSVEISEAYLFS